MSKISGSFFISPKEFNLGKIDCIFNHRRTGSSLLQPPPAPPPPGAPPYRMVTGGGVRTWPCLKPLGTQKYNLSHYTLPKTFMHTLWKGERGGESFTIKRLFKFRWLLVQTDSLFCCVSSLHLYKSVASTHAPSLVPRSRAWHINIVGRGNPAGK